MQGFFEVFSNLKFLFGENRNYIGDHYSIDNYCY